MSFPIEHLEVLCEPGSRNTLVYEADELNSSCGSRYKINNGIPTLLELTDREKNDYAINLFHEKADIYDKYQHLSFETFRLNEDDVRNDMIDKLNLSGTEKVLELNAGTGRDSILINRRLGEGKLFVQDISLEMLNQLIKKFKENEVYATQSNAELLPYRDDVFDAVYSFAGVGMNTYSDTRRIMREIVRVSKVGAKCVIGGLGLAPWLYDTEFGKILTNHNSHYANQFDLRNLPIEARNVNYEWILNGAGFCISFDIGEGEPEADFDYDIPGVRGGTLRTRYYGKLEGVSPEIKDLAYEAREKSGLSMFDLLNNAIGDYCRNIMEIK